jgi:hypothetical protein
MAFDVRVYLAAELGCAVDELVRVDGPTRRAMIIGRVTIGPLRRNLMGMERRLVRVIWPKGGGTQTDTGAGEPVTW